MEPGWPVLRRGDLPSGSAFPTKVVATADPGTSGVPGRES